MISFSTTSRGRKLLVDKNNYTYTSNAKSQTVNYWICSESKCSARIRTRVSFSNLVGDLLIHQHENKLLKRTIMEQETAVIRKMARIDGTSNARVLSEITANIQKSDTPNLICGMRSKNAIKVALFREKKKVNPAPPIPKSGDFASFMSITFPEKFTKTNDGAEFLRLKSWTNESEDEALLVFLSDTGAHVLRTHELWLLDGTFATAPVPFAQVYIVHTNSGRKGLVRGHYERIAGIVKQFSTLPPEQYINLIAHELSVH